MRKDLIIVFGILLFFAGMFLLGSFRVDPKVLIGGGSVIGMLIVVLLARRFRRAGPEVPWVCHAAAATGLLLAAANLIGGAGHSAAVASVASRLPEFGALQVLWFTTGAMLLYTGAMNAALYRAIKAGRCSAIGIAAGTSLLFVAYLLFQFVHPLPGVGEEVPAFLVGWSLYLLLLGTASIAAMRWARTRRTSDTHVVAG